MIGTVTAADVEKAVREMKITRWTRRRCSLCNAALRYYFETYGVFFDSNCNCVTYFTSPREGSFQDIADAMNMQPTDAARQELWNSFVCSGAENL